MGCCGSGGANAMDNQLWAYVNPGEKYGSLDPGQIEILGTLLAAKKIDINCKGEGGDTALHWVCREQAPPSVAMIDWLIQYGPNIEATNDASKTPLHCAVGGAHSVNVRRLLEHNANANARGLNGSTPLMYAAALGSHSNMDVLLEDRWHVDVSSVNEHGDTALNRLARLGARERNSPDDLRIAQALIARTQNIPAALETKNADGYTPLLSAVVSGKANLISYFIGLGASVDVCIYWWWWWWWWWWCGSAVSDSPRGVRMM